jgi:hypothetical protein
MLALLELSTICAERLALELTLRMAWLTFTTGGVILDILDGVVVGNGVRTTRIVRCVTGQGIVLLRAPLGSTG